VSRRASFTYFNFKSPLTGDIPSTNYATAAASLFSIGGSFGLLINRTADDPNGNGSGTPYLDLSGATPPPSTSPPPTPRRWAWHPARAWWAAACWR